MSQRILKALASLTVLLGSLAAGAAQRPNILLIISDDIGLDVSTSMYPGLIDGLAKQYGPAGLKNPSWQSIRGRPASLPNLQRLARQGTAFTHAWAQPFCSPTRASLLTGLNAGKARVLSYADPLSPRHTSFVRQLKEQGGYSTALFGKWHLAGLPGNQNPYPGMKPKQAGFDLFRGNLHAALRTYWDYDYQVQDAGSPEDRWRTEKPPVRSLPGIAPTTYAPVVKIADAIDWITEREQADPGKPWLAWVAFNLAHATIVQQPSAMAVPNVDTMDASSIAEMKACGGEFGSMNTGNCSGEALQRVMSNAMDTMTGKLLTAVDALDRNTIVIYLGDNGTPMYGRPNLDFIDNMYITRKGRGKGTVYESGARVPLVIRGPGIGANRVSREYVHVADLFPTILTLAGLAPPARVSNADGSGTLAVDGVSLVPILKGKARQVRDPDRDYLLTESLNLMTESTRDVGARDGRYKVMCHENTADGSCRFFDLEKDPLEEYPLPVPASCGGPRSDSDKPADPAWHFCRLRAVIGTESFLSQAPPAPRAEPPPTVTPGMLAPLVPAKDQQALLASPDPKLERNKRHVFDFWRIVYEGGHMERAAEFMTAEYLQHNPNVPSGRDWFVRTIGATRKPRAIAPQILVPVIQITAERDIVTVMWARKVRDREKPEETYMMTWFDVFRIDEQSGLIAEHWDSSERWGSSGRPPGAEFFP